MLNDLILLSGIDIPFLEAQVNIHQPTIKEIAYIGEESFFIGCELLRFSKNKLVLQDKNSLENQTDFDIIMSIMKDKSDINVQRSTAAAKLVLLLMFPDYKILIEEDCILFIKIVEVENNQDDIIHSFRIDNSNYDAFKKILVAMFSLTQTSSESETYNPQGDLARKIAEKLKKGKAIAAQQKGLNTNGKFSIFARYISILSVGLQLDVNRLLNYTVYQLFDEFERFELKTNYDFYIEAKKAGAKDLGEIEDWMKNLHE